MRDNRLLSHACCAIALIAAACTADHASLDDNGLGSGPAPLVLTPVLDRDLTITAELVPGRRYAGSDRIVRATARRGAETLVMPCEHSHAVLNGDSPSGVTAEEYIYCGEEDSHGDHYQVGIGRGDFFTPDDANFSLDADPSFPNEIYVLTGKHSKHQVYFEDGVFDEVQPADEVIDPFRPSSLMIGAMRELVGRFYNVPEHNNDSLMAVSALAFTQANLDVEVRVRFDNPCCTKPPLFIFRTFSVSVLEVPGDPTSGYASVETIRDRVRQLLE